MKIGIFDSGLGGLIIARAIRKAMPEFDYVYLGDTKRVPYGNRSERTVYEYTKEGVGYLFRKENCSIIILACNTISAVALSRIQKEYMPRYFPSTTGKPDRKVFGVLVPAAEEAAKYKIIGVLGTNATVASGSFPEEIKKRNSKAKVFQNPAPVLVSLAEAGEVALAVPVIQKYLKPLLRKRIDALVLGCTHYVFFKKEIRKVVGPKIKIISQDEILPKKLKKYLEQHGEVSKRISKNGKIKILLTDKTKTIDELTIKWFGAATKPKLVKL